MRWHSTLARSLALCALGVWAVACSAGIGADQDPSNQPSVTVMGTAVGSSQPAPTLGVAVSTERGN